MKKLKWFVLFIGFLLCSCGTQTEKEYKITIDYCIDNSYNVSETFPMYLEKSYTPAYSYNGHKLYVYGIRGGTTSFDHIIIYQGDLPIKILNFDYKVVRTYEASRFDGHEIK